MILLSSLISIYFRIQLYKYLRYYNRNIISIGGKPQLIILGKLQMPKFAKIVFVNNSENSTLGINRRCKIKVYDGATLTFGDRVGMSNTVIIVTKKIDIGSNVLIGGGVTIVDSDFHSMNFLDWFTKSDEQNMRSKAVIIGNNVFIGMNAIILKGVTIGDGAIIGAGSVVTTDIPSNEVWAGNPAKFIKKRC